jgi:hypothetical protein
VGLLCPIILILLRTVDRVRNQFPVSDTVTSQFIGHDFPGFAAIVSYKAPEESLRCCAIPLCLQVDINHLAILVNSTPQLMLLTVDLNEDFIDVERVAVGSVFLFPSTGVYDTKLDTPETNRFSADSDSSFGT